MTRAGKSTLSGYAASFALLLGACNLGPFPRFLEELDPLDPVEGDVKGWISVDDEKNQVLILSDSGKFLHTIVTRDAEVDLEIGDFAVEGTAFVMRPELRYVFANESGPVSDRSGAQPETPRRESSRSATLEADRLTIDGLGSFIGTADFVTGLDLSSATGRGCLLRFVQLSVRTAQARIRNFGGGGTVIYHNNESSFAGFLSGEETIVVNNLLSPDTTIDYDDFRDFPEVRLDGALVSHVNTSGDGTLDDGVGITVFGESVAGQEPDGSPGGAGGAGSVVDNGRPVVARGRLVYGPQDPIEVRQADVVGGSYDLELEVPTMTSDNFSWDFLQDLDLRACDGRFGE